MEEEPKLVIKPKFSFVYELIMPTGKKIKNTFLAFIGIILIYILLCVLKNYVSLESISTVNINAILNMVFLVLIIVIGIKLAIHIIFQVLQYKYLSYTFYSDYMVYEDNFLNQHRKTIEYSNIKEVEIRRTVTDRILGFGIIVIYTNAENMRNNGLVIYSIKNPQEFYDRIQEILKEAKKNTVENNVNNVDNSSSINNNIVENTVQNSEEKEEISEIVDFTEQDEKNFNDSLKNINNE